MKIKNNTKSGFVEEDLSMVRAKPLKKSKKKIILEGKPETATKKKKSVKAADIEEDHKSSLDRLKEIDPDFYKYLEQNDKKLLKFSPDVDEEDDKEDDSENEEVNQNDDDIGSDDDDDSDDEKKKKTHKPPSKLEVASDESDFEDDDNVMRKENSVTLKLLRTWQAELTDDKVPLETLKNVVLALNSTLLSVAGDTSAGVYRVEGAAAFNGVIQLCVLYLEPAFRRFLGLHQHTQLKPHKCKKWNKIRSSLRGYVEDVTKLLEHISSPNILIILLKHIHHIVPFMQSFPTILRPILKRLITLWSSGEETVRVLAFLCILRITRDQELKILSSVLKAMYLSYVRNAKFVSPNTLPSINFMRRSLVEMYALDLSISYQHVFLYIRQLAIHLRNAITLKKKESVQSVYNWQFINSLRLWTELLSTTYDKDNLRPLLYPLVNIIYGAIKLQPTAAFFPLRFHCIQMLIQISKETRTFIPVMPYIIEILNSNTLNTKAKVASMKPITFICLLRLNEKQLGETGFRDETFENIYSTILDYMAHESYSLSYPELCVMPISVLKKKLKDFNSKYSQKLKVLTQKLEENERFINVERKSFVYELKNFAAVSAWETKLRNKGTPLLTFYNDWQNTQTAALKRRATESDNVDDYNLPKILKRKAEPKEDESAELFPSDDDDSDLEIERKPKAKKLKKIKIEVEQNGSAAGIADDNDANDYNPDETVDIVKDLDLDDW